MQLWQCTRCKKDKDANGFYWTKDKRVARCRKCMCELASEQWAKIRATEREEYNAKRRAYHQSPARALARHRRSIIARVKRALDLADPIARKRNADEMYFRKILRKYGLSREEYEEMSQNGCCNICGGGGAKRLCVDHCHVTGKVRGLLCAKCNQGIGLFGDSPDVIRNAAAYLEASLA